jgi:hypothetical protein
MSAIWKAEAEEPTESTIQGQARHIRRNISKQ